jgi:hypothetical protein
MQLLAISRPNFGYTLHTFQSYGMPISAVIAVRLRAVSWTS